MRTVLSSSLSWAVAHIPRVLVVAGGMTVALYIALAVVSSGADVLPDPGFDCDDPSAAPSFFELVWKNGRFLVGLVLASTLVLWMLARDAEFAAWVGAVVLGVVLVGLTIVFAPGVGDVAAGTGHSRVGTLVRMVHGWPEFVAMFTVPAAVFVREQEQQTTPAYAPLMLAGVAVPLMLFGAVVESQWTFGLLC